MSRWINYLTALAVAATVSGCANLPAEHSHREASALFAERRPELAVPAAAAAATSGALSLPAALQLATRHPRFAASLAALGMQQAELEAARRLSNPSLGLSQLDQRSEGGYERSAGLGFDLGEALFFTVHRRAARGELQRAQAAAAADWLGFVGEVERQWYTAAAAEQIAELRRLFAQAAIASAQLASRMNAAGTLPRLAYEQERAAAASARINQVRAEAAALHERSALAEQLGWSGAELPQLDARLPMPAEACQHADWAGLARQQRLDLLAAERNIELRRADRQLAQRWRWLGAVELGVERESEADGTVRRGPSLELQLPIFNQGQAAIARAEAALGAAEAERDQLNLQIAHEARSAAAACRLHYDVALRYRDVLLPSRERIVELTRERVDFMLAGVFEALRARQDEFDAYQEYLETVRDYWLARSTLRQAVGGRLADESQPPATLGAPRLDSAAADPHSHHSSQ